MIGKRAGKIALALLFVLCLAVSATALYLSLSGRAAQRQGQYVLYIGMNDKDTSRQELTTEQCRALVEEKCLARVAGYTLLSGTGAWKDGETVVRENSLVLLVNGAREEDIRLLARDILTALNQSSLLIEHHAVRSYFYGE